MHVNTRTPFRGNLIFIFLLFFIRPELKPVDKDTEVVLKFPEAEKLSPPILQLDELTFHYVPGKPVFTNVNVNANMESRVCIVSSSQLYSCRMG